jgi:hypothetical protein
MAPFHLAVALTVRACRYGSGTTYTPPPIATNSEPPGVIDKLSRDTRGTDAEHKSSAWEPWRIDHDKARSTRAHRIAVRNNLHGVGARCLIPG